ncbi:YbaB/EbfC DNA-binding family protein [Prauserella aidingensis]|uniref:YbaB/EbfC family nucleoid-associated protein n=1 Tax=Prauserella aidingensis TaxID=387890 RepID=UPI0020A52950|nr:YbaB/EbfC family nucleoid-associated protein [Prauserella aidingensis]MCP2253912.1 YbaB/EbfC DNA-binding family protein [Prauserella aidingensis]
MNETARHLVQRIQAVDDAAAANRNRAETYRAMTEKLAEVTGTASSADGTVTVEAGPDGAVEKVTFSDAVRSGVEPAELAVKVQHAIALARVAATREQAEVVQRGLGSSDLLDTVLAEDRTLFGDAEPVDPGPEPVAAAADGVIANTRRSGRGDDEDFEDFPVMR